MSMPWKVEIQLTETSRSESEWSEVTPMEEEPEKANGMQIAIPVGSIPKGLSEEGADEPMHSLPSSPRGVRLPPRIGSPVVQDAPSDGLLSEQDAMKFTAF